MKMMCLMLFFNNYLMRLPQIFQKEMDDRRIPAAKLTRLLTSIGRAQTLVTKIRYTGVSMNRMLSFLAGSKRLNEAAAQTLHNPEIRAKLIAIGGEPVGNSPQEFAAFLRDDYQKNGVAAKQAGLKAD